LTKSKAPEEILLRGFSFSGGQMSIRLDTVEGDHSPEYKQGCQGAHLDTFSFQAKGFYEKLGYRVFGELEECPAGNSRFYLWKKL
jgi:hypothetical protein